MVKAREAGSLEYLLVALVAAFVSGLTLYSGFGLGTLLMPIFALFFPVEVAIAATAIVHGANNVFKVSVLGRYADRSLVLGFGLPAIGAAFVGAAALGYVSDFGEIARYHLGTHLAVVTPLKVAMGLLMFAFAMLELLPSLRAFQFDRKYLFVGGLLSGFFGGFSGHQGALRSAFLAKVGVTTEAFVGTNAVIGFLVDAARIATYAVVFLLAQKGNPIGPEQGPLILTGIVAAITGVVVGKRFLHKVTMKTVQMLTGTLLLAIAVALGSGLI